MIRLAGESDLDFLMAHDRHIGAQELARIVRLGRVYIATDADGTPFFIGVCRNPSAQN